METCNASAPLLLYYSHIPVLVAGVILTLFTLFSNTKSPVNRNLFVSLSFFDLWIVGSMLQWSITNVYLNLFVTRVSILAIFFLLFFLYFSYELLGGGLRLKIKLLFAIPFAPFLALLFTDMNVYIENVQTCNVLPGPLYVYLYLIAFVYLLWQLILYIKFFKAVSEDEAKVRQAKIIIKAVVFVLAWMFALIGFALLSVKMNLSWGAQPALLIPIGMIIFIGLIVYAITKYQFLNVKVVAAQVLTVGSWIVIASQLLFVDNNVNRILVFLTLTITVFFGIVLLRSLRNEEVIKKNLAQANSRLQKLDKTKSEFLSIASHQLRTPISGIKGYLSMILEGDFGKVEDKPKEILQSIYDNTERLNGLVNDFLDVSRIERGKLVMERQPTDMAEMIESVVMNYKPVVQAKGIKMEYEAPKVAIPKINIDPNKLRQVVLNLVDNAIKYTHEGSIHVSLTGYDDHLRVCVKDTGVGLEPGDVKRLFKPFVRTSDASKSNATGSGLGLYVAKKIVQYHGGKVWAESEGKGKGSMFSMEVPYDQSTIPEPEPEPYLE